MRALVTGGAGFIGSHLVDRLVADGHHADVVDDLSAGRLDNLAAAVETGRCQVVTANVVGHDIADWIVSRQPEVVFHLAAQIDVRTSVARPRFDAMTNVLGTINVLEAARAAGARKVVNVSSVAIYGHAEQLPVTADTPANPLSPYAASKLAAEMYCRQYQQLHGLAATTVVLTNVYGPRQSPHFGAVAIWTAAMLAGEPTYLYGGHNIRDYVYVADAVDALVAAASPAVTASRIPVGTGIPVTDRQLHTAVAVTVGIRATPVVHPMRAGDLPAMVVDPQPARRLLNWQPQTPLAVGLCAVRDHTRVLVAD
jgi:UDP-glucose 4-epimerase